MPVYEPPKIGSEADVPAVACPKLECGTQPLKVVGRIEDRLGFPRDVADEQITVAGVGQ